MPGPSSPGGPAGSAVECDYFRDGHAPVIAQLFDGLDHLALILGSIAKGDRRMDRRISIPSGAERVKLGRGNLRSDVLVRPGEEDRPEAGLEFHSHVARLSAPALVLGLR